MSEPTICVECKHVEVPTRNIFGGQHLCLVEPERMDFVTGQKYQPKPVCAVRNALGKCADFARKGA